MPDADLPPATRGTTRLAAATVALGFGLVGIVEVALVHLVPGWHHFDMRGDLAAPLRSDGLLLAALWLVALLATLALWRIARLRVAPFDGRVLWGGLLAGAGVFHVLDLLVDHLWLGLHRLQAGEASWTGDLAWLAGGAFLVGAGWGLLARAARDADPEDPPAAGGRRRRALGR